MIRIFFKRKGKSELKFLKDNLESFEQEMFDKLSELEGNLETVRGEDQKKYRQILNNETKQRHSIESLTKEILNSVELLEKNQKLLGEEIARLKDKIEG